MKPWLKLRLQTLTTGFTESQFTMSQASELLARKHRDKEEKVLVVLSELKKEGELEVSLDPVDSRRRIYQLKKTPLPERLLNRGDLEALCKKAADLIRTRVDYSFILLLLFYKRISDKWRADYDSALKKAVEEYNLTPEEAAEEARNSLYHDFSISEQYLWDNIRKDPTKLAENFSLAMKDIADKNPQLAAVFQNFDFHQFASNTENQELLRSLVELFSSLSLQTVGSDMLGDAYEWTLRYFAPQKAKEGEVYTPREVVKLLIEYLDPKPGEDTYDPASGSAGMLIVTHQHVRERFGDEEVKSIRLFGEEANIRTHALAKMNMYLHGIKNVDIEYGDSILYPKFKDGSTFRKFDVVVANPPWNQDGYGEQRIKDADYRKDRFPYGFAPDQSADWAWIQLMLASAKPDTGRVGVIIDNGALFRGGKEKAIRQQMIEGGKIEAVILLPEKLFYNTGAPGAIIILRHNRPESEKGKILFINASNEFKQHPEVRRLNRLNDNHIEKVVSARQKNKIEGFSRQVDVDEIVENDYNLNVTLYVVNHSSSERVNVKKEWAEIDRLDNELTHVRNQLSHFLLAIGPTDNTMQEIDQIGTGAVKGWKPVQLGDVCRQRNEILQPRSIGDLPFIGLEHVPTGRNFVHSFGKPNDLRSAKYRFYPNDILYGKLRPYLDKCVVAPIDGVCSTDLLTLECLRDRVLPVYLASVLHSEAFTRHAVSSTSGTNHPRTNWKAISKFEFMLPPLEEQRKAVEILTALDTQLELDLRKRTHFERVRLTLLNDLITGTIRHPDFLKEP